MKIKKYQTPSTSIDYTDDYREVINNGVPKWKARAVETDLYYNNYYGAPEDYQFEVSPGEIPEREFNEAYYNPNSAFLKAVGERQLQYFNKRKPINYLNSAKWALKRYNNTDVVEVNYPYHYSGGYRDALKSHLYLGTLMDYPTQWPKEFVYGHESSHLIEPHWHFKSKFLGSPYLKKILKLNTNTITEGDPEATEHDSMPSEKRADLHGIKAQLYKMGLFDPSKDTEISKEAILKLREAYPDLRPLKLMDDEKLYFMLNHIAYNKNNNVNNYV